MVEATMTPEERVLVEKLRNLVKDDLSSYYDTDYNLLRWLQGHNNDIDSFIRKFRCHLRFRKCWDLDNLHKSPRNHPIHSHWPNGLTGLSLRTENSFINVEQAGINDYWGLLHTYSPIDVMRARLYDLEMMLMKCMQHEKETGQQASIIYVMDLKDLQYDKNLISMVTGPLKCLMQFMADHYVDLIKYFVFVSTPTFFQILYRVLKPLVPERSANKARILGADWRREILEYSDPSVLPDFWNIEGDHTFTGYLGRPVKYDVSKYTKKAINSEHTLLSVGAGKTEYISVNAKAGAKLRWSIFANGEFGFGVFYSSDPAETDDMKMEMIYPQYYRVTTPNIVPLEDLVHCEKTGVYKFWIDNSTAWWYTLKIHYKINVE